MHALTDASPDVREQAAWALGAIGDSRAISSLLVALKDDSVGVRRQAAWAIGAMGADSARLASRGSRLAKEWPCRTDHS